MSNGPSPLRRFAGLHAAYLFYLCALVVANADQRWVVALAGLVPWSVMASALGAMPAALYEWTSGRWVDQTPPHDVQSIAVLSWVVTLSFFAALLLPLLTFLDARWL